VSVSLPSDEELNALKRWSINIYIYIIIVLEEQLSSSLSVKIRSVSCGVHPCEVFLLRWRCTAW